MASIKRIIAEPPTPAIQPESEPEVLELGSVASAAPAQEPPRARWEMDAVPAVRAAQPAPPIDEPAPLVSQAAREASQRAMAALSGVAVDPSAPAHTLDGLVREMLRPMLKEWLDAHLPDLVERVVAREVARLGGH